MTCHIINLLCGLMIYGAKEESVWTPRHPEINPLFTPIGYIDGCRPVVASRQLILAGSHVAIAGKTISINTINHVGSMLKTPVTSLSREKEGQCEQKHAYLIHEGTQQKQHIHHDKNALMDKVLAVVKRAISTHK